MPQQPGTLLHGVGQVICVVVQYLTTKYKCGDNIKTLTPRGSEQLGPCYSVFKLAIPEKTILGQICYEAGQQSLGQPTPNK